MAVYQFSCTCGNLQEIRTPTMDPPCDVACIVCWRRMNRIYSPPLMSVHQTGAEWLNEVAAGRGEPPAGLTQAQGKVAALAKARSDKQMGSQSSKQPTTISTSLSPVATPYIPE